MKTNQNYHYVVFFSLDTNERNYEACSMLRGKKASVEKKKL